MSESDASHGCQHTAEELMQNESDDPVVRYVNIAAGDGVKVRRSLRA